MKKISKDTPYHTEQLWALIKEEPNKTTSMMYVIGPTQKELWDAVVDLEWYGTGYTKQMLQAQGWNARRIFVEEKG